METLNEDHERIHHMLEDFYGIETQEIKDMPAPSHNDRSFHIKYTTKAGKIVESVLKEISISTKEIDGVGKSVIGAQAAVFKYLAREGFLCPQPIKTLEGTTVWPYTGHEEYMGHEGKPQAVQMLTYLHGTPVSSLPITRHVLYDVGKLLGKLRSILQNFKHEAIAPLSAIEIWETENFPTLRTEARFYISDNVKFKLVDDVVQRFEVLFKKRMTQLDTGLTHGDLHPANIIVHGTHLDDPEEDKENSSDPSSKYALVDFSLMSYSFCLFELAVSFASFMMASDDVDFRDVGGHMMAGYNSVTSLPQLERDLFYISICTVYCKVLLTTAFLGNTPVDESCYVGKVVKRVWPQLQQLWDMEPDELFTRWDSVIDNYKLK